LGLKQGGNHGTGRDLVAERAVSLTSLDGVLSIMTMPPATSCFARGQFFDRLSTARRRENGHGSELGLARVANS
jgi:hypothetical protein